MSLATRCAHCGTIFRVVQDQLKVSEGWVRCGRCDQVFSAIEGLFDLDGAGTPSSPGALRGPETGLPAHQLAPVSDEPPSARAPGRIDDDTQALTRSSTAFDLGGNAMMRQRALADDEDAPIDRGHDGAPHGAGDPAHAGAEPSFLREARWETPRMRRALGALAAALALLLVGQWSVQQRDSLSAQWPSAAPLLSALCAPLGCGVEPLRRLDALAVDSSGLTRIEGTSLYRLQVVLRNRHDTAVMTPALDLTLTDARSDAVARRALLARDLDPRTPQRVVAGGELTLTALLDLGERRVAGYTIELFYP